MMKKNIFTQIPQSIPNELFEDIIVSKDLKIERIVSYGHSSPETGWYQEKSNEWVIVLQGEAIISFENTDDVRLKVGDYLNIEANKKHKVSWTIPNEKTIWLAIHY